MSIEERIIIKAPQQEIYAVYEDVAGWSSWDPDVVSSSLDGDFMRGTTGRLKPKKGPESKIELTEVTRDHSFTTTARLLLCSMSFEHELSASGGQTEVVHKVLFTGFLAPVFSRLIGTGIAKGLPSSLLGLKKHIESRA